MSVEGARRYTRAMPSVLLKSRDILHSLIRDLLLSAK